MMAKDFQVNDIVVVTENTLYEDKLFGFSKGDTGRVVELPDNYRERGYVIVRFGNIHDPQPTDIQGPFPITRLVVIR
jgi:hypothetical protein